MIKKYSIYVPVFIAALVMLQTLYFKFSASQESVYIFTKVGIEPWGRIGTSIAELIASLLLFIPRSRFLGAFIGAGIMFGAITLHFFLLGIEIMNDKGYLFFLAWVVLLCCSWILYVEKEKIRRIMNLLQSKFLKN